MSHLTADILFWTLAVLQFGVCLHLLYTVVMTELRLRFDWRWAGYDEQKARMLIRRFAHDPDDLDLEIGIVPDQSAWRPTMGQFRPDCDKIEIDTRIVRNTKDLVSTLLHEICHHNQFVQGRLRSGSHGLYELRPCEREARAFAKAWFRVAMNFYRRG
jgi:hypothetical protein